MKLSVDTIRALATYGICLFVVVAGFAFFAYVKSADGDKALVGGFVGSALTFLFNGEVGSRSARQVTSAATNLKATNGEPKP